MSLYITDQAIDLTFKNLGKGIYVSLKQYDFSHQFVIERTKAEWYVFIVENGEELYIFDKESFRTFYEAEQFAKWLHLGFIRNYVAKGDAIDKEHLND